MFRRPAGICEARKHLADMYEAAETVRSAVQLRGGALALGEKKRPRSIAGTKLSEHDRAPRYRIDLFGPARGDPRFEKLADSLLDQSQRPSAPEVSRFYPLITQRSGGERLLHNGVQMKFWPILQIADLKVISRLP